MEQGLPSFLLSKGCRRIRAADLQAFIAAREEKADERQGQ